MIIAGCHILPRDARTLVVTASCNMYMMLYLYNTIHYNKYNTVWNAMKLAAGLSEVYHFDTLGNLM